MWMFRTPDRLIDGNRQGDGRAVMGNKQQAGGDGGCGGRGAG